MDDKIRVCVMEFQRLVQEKERERIRRQVERLPRPYLLGELSGYVKVEDVLTVVGGGNNDNR